MRPGSRAPIYVHRLISASVLRRATYAAQKRGDAPRHRACLGGRQGGRGCVGWPGVVYRVLSVPLSRVRVWVTPSVPIALNPEGAGSQVLARSVRWPGRQAGRPSTWRAARHLAAWVYEINSEQESRRGACPPSASRWERRRGRRPAADPAATHVQERRHMFAESGGATGGKSPG